RDKPLIVIAPGAAHPNKQWPVDRFAEVAIQLNRTYDASIIWAVMAADRGQSGLEERLPAGSFREFVDTPLDRLGGLISQARVTIGNDSGLAHLSSAIGTPVVAVFGPTHRALGFAPKGIFDTVIDVDEFCRPCSLHGKKLCYRDKRYCFERITPEMVSDAAGQILDLRIGAKGALFVDRDGTVVVDKDFLSDPGQVEFEQGSVEALQTAIELGLKIVIVSNQSGVARGMFDCITVERVNKRLLEMLAAAGIEIDGIYYCPHHPQGRIPEFTQACNCRKPAPGMLEEASRQLGIDLRKSYVIGDKLDDFNLGHVVGAKSYLVRTGYGAGQESQLPNSCTNNNKCVFDNLLMAVQHIKMIEENDKGSRPL
ncbi:MAG: HAD-IIIA family hydrolase, partial [candidate division Zixibacteria bacterium]|nr:HAD-IIIA family hydrolase [candidate division Zixibacteria bacterium]